jgi:hypothetical protein
LNNYLVDNIHQTHGGYHKSKVHLCLPIIYTALQHRTLLKGLIMTTAIYTQSSERSLRHYLKDVSIAARAFAAALFAAQERQFIAQEVRATRAVSARDKANGRRQLFSLANQYANSAPSLCAELRSIASRD